MFELGNSLHEARIRQGVDLPTAEIHTKIRAKYLKALEEEHFDLLPAETYVKGFLRTYAEFLGLDGQLYVDEYSSRFVVGEDDGRAHRPRRSTAQPQRRSRRLESSAVLVTLAAIGLVAALVIVAWRSGDGNRRAPLTTDTTVVQAPSKPRTHPSSKIAHLVVTAKRGNSLLEVHAGSAAGKLLFQGTLLRGKSVAFDGKRLWLDVTAPANLVARLNGNRRRLPGTRPRTLVVTARGIETASIG